MHLRPAESLLHLTARHWACGPPRSAAGTLSPCPAKAPPWSRRVADAQGPARPPGTLVERIETLFERHGRDAARSSRAHPLTPLEHALQCAHLAEWMQADDALVAAALLHDIGHLVAMDRGGAGFGAARQPHERAAVDFLGPDLGAGVLEPIALHVQARRYLAGIDPAYQRTLSGRSLRSLERRGGPMPPAEREAFALHPYASQAIALRRCDDLACCPGKPTPPLARYLRVLDDVLDAQRPPAWSAGVPVLV